MARKLSLFLLLLTILCTTAFAQRRLLSLERIYDPKTKENFGGIPQRDFVWLDDQTFLWPKSDSRGNVSEYVIYEVKSGKEKPLFDRRRLQEAITGAGVEAKEAERLSSRRSLVFNDKRNAILLTLSDDLYVYSLAAATLARLTETPAKEEEATFSPDGSMVAFVRDSNVYTIKLGDKTERQLTTGGHEELLNGKLDWVYQEEIYGRGRFRAYWWSPDSTRIAYLQLNERGVPEFTVVDHIPYRQELEVTDYPKAGDPNPTVGLFVVDVKDGAQRQIDDAKYANSEFLIVDVSWTPDSREIVYQVQDREQIWLDLNLADAGTGSIRTLLRETTPAWVEVNGSPEWLDDSTFLWFSERSGFKHLYQYRRDGSLVRQITNGPWEARTLHGIDKKNGWLYFSGTERSPIGSDLYRIRLDGSRLTRLSTAPGTHSASFSPGFVYFLDTWSEITTPAQVHLHRTDGTKVRTIDPNVVELLKSYTFTTPEFLQVKTRDGFVMEAVMIKPPDFDPTRKYPVYQSLYGGPHAQTVRNSWSDGNVFHQLLAQNGIIVWMCDNRTASGKGAVSTWPLYKRFGETELADVEDGIAWLKQQPWVDGSRIMLNGWSYGGFMVSYALTHSKSFAAGIAGGSVTDWRDYDTIYTERYMLTPQHNEEGYRKSSPRFEAAQLHGELLLLHGTIDDNVHVQNTIQFAHELQKAGKKFELMLYPKARHGISDPAAVYHLRQLMLDFVLRSLSPSGRGN